MASDAVVLVVALAIANLSRFGRHTGELHVEEHSADYWTVTAVTAALWWVFLTAWGTREQRVLGQGSEEYKRVASATAWLFGVIAVVSYVLRIDTSRGYVGIAFPAGLFLLLVSRWLWRQWLVRARTAGRFTSRVMLLGGPGAVLHLHTSLTGQPGSGYQPVAAYLPGYSATSPDGEELPLPVVGTSRSVDEILTALADCDADALAISTGAALSPRAIRRLGWELSDRQIGLIMAPALTDVAGPRIHTQPIAGLPLIHVSTPRLSGINASMKRTLDLVLASAALLLLLPVFVLTAAAVKADSRGPVFFAQERVGRDGKRFRMFKFRSMVTDAEARLAGLERQAGAGNDVLFKLKDDPRITRVGGFIRRYSLDELPQLLNVLRGEMSLVGPRPPLPREVEKYEAHVHRRLLVLPGITGLWQVSGRSNLSWDDTVRLDLYYVENWSVAQDLLIMLKTVRAVVASRGAY